MIFRLEYCNSNGDSARVDIKTPVGSEVYLIEGTGDPFSLKRKRETPDKSGYIMTSSAEINIYETPFFNIDTLKTSSETEIKVDYYVNDVKEWTGFVIPDFFSREIGGSGVVSMTASDRINSLKGVTLSDLPARVSLRFLAEECLKKTGLSLPLNTMADFSAVPSSFNDFFRSEIYSQRIYDVRGRSISCYDILRSILVASNSMLIQSGAEWYMINRLQHEIGTGLLYSSDEQHALWQPDIVHFDEIIKGSTQSIIPVAASVGIFHEHGGGRLHPDNYDFSKGLTGWNSIGGFNAVIDNRNIKSYTTGATGGAEYKPDYGDDTAKNYLINNNQYVRNNNPIYLESEEISIPYSGEGSIEVSMDINAIGPGAVLNSSPAYIRASIIAIKGDEMLTLDHGGKFVPMPSINPPVFSQKFEDGFNRNNIPALTEGLMVKGILEVSELSSYKLKIRLYGGGPGRPVIINSVNLVMKSSGEVPKGVIFKTETQAGNYTKAHDIETTILGDYLMGGLNGYFYKYPIDDTSSLYAPDGSLRTVWTAPGDSNEFPLLLHATRQMSRLFNTAHDLIRGEIDIIRFNPLSILEDCNGKRYVIVSCEEDFLRGTVYLEIEEAYPFQT